MDQIIQDAIEKKIDKRSKEYRNAKAEASQSTITTQPTTTPPMAGASVTYLKVQTAFSPPGFAPQLSLATKGANSVKSMVIVPGAVDIELHNGRTFLVPFANVPFLEYIKK